MIYTNKWIQGAIILLYPSALFGMVAAPIDSIWSPSPWPDILILVLFCGLWKNVGAVLLSTILTCMITIPLWNNFIAPNTPDGRDLIAMWPIVAARLLLMVLLPQIMIVFFRNLAIPRITIKK